MVAIPLEMLLDSGRHVAAAFVAFGLSALGHLTRVLAHGMGSFSHALLGLYDVYISIPLRIERMIRGRRADADDVRGSDRDTEARVRSGGVA
jgi:hypothetical protein